MSPSPYKNIRREEAIRQAKQKKMRLLMLITVLVLVVVVIGVLVAQKSGGSGSSDPFQLEKQPMLGKADAPITIVEFGDFKCPICMQYATNIYPKVKQDFVDTGLAKVYFINYSFIGPDSTTAAAALESVHNLKPESAFPFIEAMYKNQGDERKLWATPEAIVDIAKKEKVDVDYDALLSDIKKNKYSSDVRSDNRIASKLKLTGTPTIFVNGTEVTLETVFNYDSFKAIIQNAQKQGAAQ